MRNVVNRLQSLGMEAALTHDSEFLSAVYCALPDRHQLRWLEWPKTRDHWSNMLSFLDRTYEMATHELALLTVYKKDEKKVFKTAQVSAAILEFL